MGSGADEADIRRRIALTRRALFARLAVFSPQRARDAAVSSCSAARARFGVTFSARGSSPVRTVSTSSSSFSACPRASPIGSEHDDEYAAYLLVDSSR